MSAAANAPARRDEAPALPDPDALLAAYGLDARARSALRSYARHAQADAAWPHRADALEAALAPGDTGIGDARGQLFVDLFAALPESDFAADWLERLARAWDSLRRAGSAPDLPLRAARALAAHAGEVLLSGKTQLSATETEILAAVAAAGMCAAAYLQRAGALAPGSDYASRRDDSPPLAAALTGAIAQAAGRCVGLLFVRLRPGPATLTLDPAQRDALWAAAIERMDRVLRPRDLLVRTERHACAIVLPDLGTHAQVMLAANKVAAVLRTPLRAGESSISAPFAVGAAWSPEHGATAEDLSRCADLALEEAGRQDVPLYFFDAALLAAARQEARIEKEFAAALENGQLALGVQPQIDLKSGRCVGGEMLLRWVTTNGESVPAQKIPGIAQRIGLAPRLTRWLLFGACRTLAELTRAGVDIELSVNLLARDLMDEELPLLVDQAIAFWRVPPHRLTFELTETMMLEDPMAGAGAMRRLLDLGVGTSIDDFGVGYSSILYLRQLPLRELKIDISFVLPMARSPQDREIVAALIGLAHALDLRVVAEGVENEETLAQLRALGCDRAQGFFISHAMAPSELAAWVQAWNASQA